MLRQIGKLKIKENEWVTLYESDTDVITWVEDEEGNRYWGNYFSKRSQEREEALDKGRNDFLMRCASRL